MSKEECQQDQAALSPTFQVDDGSNIAPAQQSIPQIKQDEYNSSPAANTRQQCKIWTLTHDFMLQCMEIPGYTAPFTLRQAASRKYPLQFLCDLACAVLDDKTGGLLKYHQLMKHPKYKDVWTKSFSKEIVRLATTTETIFSVNKTEIPKECRGDVTYGRIVCMYRDTKKDKFQMRITMGLAGNVRICVCWLHPPNDRHLCLLPTCRKCRPDTSATFCYVGLFFSPTKSCRGRLSPTQSLTKM